MSRLSGICFFDGRSVGLAERKLALRALGAPHGQDVEHFVYPGVLMLGSGESGTLRSLQTSCGQSDPIIGSWDGRIDNWIDVARLVQAPAIKGKNNNCDLALSLLARFGVEGLGQIVGDWSGVFWDPGNRELLLASDFAGIRPLYFHVDSNGVQWSSTLALLVEWLGFSNLDEDFIAIFLQTGTPGPLTPYKGVYPVPPGHVAKVSSRGIRISRIWDFPDPERFIFKRDEDYELRLSELFNQSVAARLDSPRPIVVELSGGLDSSSILCTANRLYTESLVKAPRLLPLSYLEPNGNDERFVSIVERHCGLAAHRLSTEEFPFISATQAGEAFPSFWGPRLAEVARLMKQNQSSTLLTGQGGDLVMANWLDDSEQVGDLLANGNIWPAIVEAFSWSQALRVPIYPILWRAVQAILFPWYTPSASDPRPSLVDGDSLTAPTARRANNYKTNASMKECVGRVGLAHRKRRQALLQLIASRALRCPEVLQENSVTHPFLHRPLVEFMMSIPPHISCRPNSPRLLMRKSFTELLPDAIRRRSSKAIYQLTFRRSLRPLAAAILPDVENMWLVKHNHIDPVSLRSRLIRFQQGLDCNESQLRNIILTEFWVRQRLQSM